MDRRAIGRPLRLGLHRGMERPQRPKPPDHRHYPRGVAAAPVPQKPVAPPAAKIPLWSRAVPEDRSFPRS